MRQWQTLLKRFNWHELLLLLLLKEEEEGGRI